MHTKNNKTDEIKQEGKGNSAQSDLKLLSLPNEPTLDVLQEKLVYLEKNLPRQNQHIFLLKQLKNLLKLWEKATPYQRRWLCFFVSVARMNLDEDRDRFYMAHAVVAKKLGCCEKTCERAARYWADCFVIFKDMLRFGYDKTINRYFTDSLALSVVIVGDSLKINFHDKTGKKKFVTLKEYITLKVRELLVLEKKRLGKLGLLSSSPRECLSYHNVYIKIEKSSIDKSKDLPGEKENFTTYLYDSYFLNGILLENGIVFKLKPIDIKKFRWFSEDIVLQTINSFKNISISKLLSLREPIRYLLRCCNNLKHGNLSWKRPHFHWQSKKPTYSSNTRSDASTSRRPGLPPMVVAHLVPLSMIPSGWN